MSGISAQVTFPTEPQWLVKNAKGSRHGCGEAEMHPRDGPPAGPQLDQHLQTVLCQDGRNPLRQTHRGGYNPREGLRRANNIRLSVSSFCYCGRDHHLMNLFIRRQPLMSGQFVERRSQNLEQYLTGVLDELHPWCEEQNETKQYMFERGKRITHLQRINAN